jgi:hypothetical protein
VELAVITKLLILDLVGLIKINIHNAVFWDVNPCGLVDGYQCFGRIYYLHLQIQV